MTVGMKEPQVVDLGAIMENSLPSKYSIDWKFQNLLTHVSQKYSNLWGEFHQQNPYIPMYILKTLPKVSSFSIIRTRKEKNFQLIHQLTSLPNQHFHSEQTVESLGLFTLTMMIPWRHCVSLVLQDTLWS